MIPYSVLTILILAVFAQEYIIWARAEEVTKTARWPSDAVGGRDESTASEGHRTKTQISAGCELHSNEEFEIAMSHNPWSSIATAVVILIAVCAVAGCFPGSESPHPESPQSQPPSQQTTARGWPNWMGPNFDGISKEKGWSSKWPEDGLKKIWERQIGLGFSSISIADNH